MSVPVQPALGLMLVSEHVERTLPTVTQNRVRRATSEPPPAARFRVPHTPASGPLPAKTGPLNVFACATVVTARHLGQRGTRQDGDERRAGRGGRPDQLDGPVPAGDHLGAAAAGNQAQDGAQPARGCGRPRCCQRCWRWGHGRGRLGLCGRGRRDERIRWRGVQSGATTDGGQHRAVSWSRPAASTILAGPGQRTQGRPRLELNKSPLSRLRTPFEHVSVCFVPLYRLHVYDAPQEQQWLLECRRVGV